MMPPGHILSVLDVAALGTRFFSLCPENFRGTLPLTVLFCPKPVMTFKTSCETQVHDEGILPLKGQKLNCLTYLCQYA